MNSLNFLSVPLMAIVYVALLAFALWLDGTGWPHIKDDDK